MFGITILLLPIITIGIFTGFFKTQYPKKTTAIFSTWLDNRTKLVGSDSIKGGNLQPDFYFDGMELDTIRYPQDTAGYFYHLIDEAVADTTVAYIKRVAPDLTWVYLEYTMNGASSWQWQTNG
jgi:hypothetical protein